MYSSEAVPRLAYGGDPSAAISSAIQPTPMPTVTRPLESTSAVVSILAARMAGRCGTTITEVSSRMRLRHRGGIGQARDLLQAEAGAHARPVAALVVGIARGNAARDHHMIAEAEMGEAQTICMLRQRLDVVGVRCRAARTQMQPKVHETFLPLQSPGRCRRASWARDSPIASPDATATGELNPAAWPGRSVAIAAHTIGSKPICVRSRSGGIAAEEGREPLRLRGQGRAGADAGGVDGRELELPGQRAHQRHARRIEDLGDLRAAYGMRVRRASQRLHGGGAVGERTQPRGHLSGDAERVEHLGEMDAGGRQLRIGEIYAVRRQQRRAQRRCIGDARGRIAAAHRHPRAHDAEVDGRARQHVTGARQLGDQGSREDQQVGRRSGQQLVAHGPDGAERARDPAAGLGLELGRERAHQPLGRAAAQHADLHADRSSAHRRDDALARDRQVANAHAQRIEDGVADGCGRGTVRRLSGTDGLLLGPVDDLHLHRRHLREAQDRIASPRCRW